MFEIVRGQGKNIFAQHQLQNLLKELNLNGTLYLGYPIIASSDEMVVIDSLLTCLEFGVVVIDFGTADGADAEEKMRERQDNLYTALQRKLLQYKPLVKARELIVPINVLTFVPDDDAIAKYSGLEVAGPETLDSKSTSYSRIDNEALKLVNAAIQRVATIKPTD